MERTQHIAPRTVQLAGWLVLVAVAGSGCAPAYHFLHYHAPFEAIARSNKSYFHSQQTGRVIEKNPCATYCEPGCFGYEPTCWTKWPAECPENCPVQGDVLVDGSIILHEEVISEGPYEEVPKPASPGAAKPGGTDASSVVPLPERPPAAIPPSYSVTRVVEPEPVVASHTPAQQKKETLAQQTHTSPPQEPTTQQDVDSLQPTITRVPMADPEEPQVDVGGQPSPRSVADRSPALPDVPQGEVISSEPSRHSSRRKVVKMTMLPTLEPSALAEASEPQNVANAVGEAQDPIAISKPSAKLPAGPAFHDQPPFAVSPAPVHVPRATQPLAPEMIRLSDASLAEAATLKVNEQAAPAAAAKSTATNNTRARPRMKLQTASGTGTKIRFAKDGERQRRELVRLGSQQAESSTIRFR